MERKSFTFDVKSPFGGETSKYTFFPEGDERNTAPNSLEVEGDSFKITDKTATITFTTAIPAGKKLLATYTLPSQPTPPAPPTPAPQTSTNPRYVLQKVIGEVVGKGDGTKTKFALSRYPVGNQGVAVTVGTGNQPTVTVNNDLEKQVSTITLNSPPSADAQITVDYYPLSVAGGEVQLCTNFTEFKKSFGDFSTVEGQSNLAHAVYGFFRNGGTRCFVTWVATKNIDTALEDFAAIDEIAIVAAPGSTDLATLGKLSDHCQALGDRVAIFDALRVLKSAEPGQDGNPGESGYAALYYPWIQVLDPATNQNKYVPPSGHIAGVYARVDAQRGVHKAPANEVVLGAIGLETALTRAKQDGLNPKGVNCIRNLNGNITVWGARTWGGDDNGEFKYINIRRLFNYLRESIDEGTQWVVFEPNSPELWARVRRSVTAFLTMVWRSGALFGATPEEAFFVQCDAETNPPEARDAGQLNVKIGVAVVKPAEFVIFELSQWSGGK
ncbi:phage tail sheath family protein [Nodosilinea sp. FACHB-141]|nr:phage tail sheath family protein [Nodosilinea sp. FACHB-141]